MSDFEKWFRSLNANGKIVYFLGNEHKVSEMAWNHQQAIIDSLRAQLNNMETCYIEKKKQVEAVEYVLGCAMIGPKEVFQYADTIGKALRGEHD